ncbi:hypothetical protein DID88_007914 [Monilinia fructigena]|uniref:Uncharacterized protein n=1 Tax=Monilinia fructigena TaxID=38457 RepID=A0A395J4C4_9HELO|nr:hypothetical protein DID88_007914 [Monilinia fructigena]
MRQASSAVALAGGPVKTVERLLQAAVHTRDLHRSQIRNLTASLEGSDTQVAILKNEVENLKKDLETVNNGSAAMLWQEKEKQYLELKKRTDEGILERDLKIKRLRDSRDDNPATSLGLDVRGQQTLRRQREELITAENELAHSQMLIEALMNKEAKFDEERERIKKEAVHGTSERLQELYTNSTIQVEELSEKLKRLEHFERSENDIAAFQRQCKEEKESCNKNIADKAQQISTYEALIDHAMASMDWDDNRFYPIDKYYGYISGAKVEIRRLEAEILQLGLSRLSPGRRIESLDELSLEKDRLLDERVVLRKTRDDLQNRNIQHEKNLIRFREQLIRRNTQITNLQAQNTKLRAELRDGRAVVPLAGRLSIAGIAAPVIEIFIRHLLDLEREIRNRGREVDELPALPGIDGVPKIEREPGDISILRIVLWIGDRFDYLSTLIEKVSRIG